MIHNAQSRAFLVPYSTSRYTSYNNIYVIKFSSQKNSMTGCKGYAQRHHFIDH